MIVASRPLKVVCHKAFDETLNEDAALDQLIALGVNEVLTSGHQKTALEGVKNLQNYRQRAGYSIQIMAGGTVRAENVKSIVKESGVIAVHSRATDMTVFKNLVASLREVAPKPAPLHFNKPVIVRPPAPQPEV